MPLYSIILLFFRQHPGRSAVVLLSLIVTATAEAFSIAVILPLFRLLGGGASTEPGSYTTIEAIVAGAFDMVSVPLNPGTLLAVIVSGFLIKGGVTFVAMRQVGYAGAQVAADLRLSLVGALVRARWSYFLDHPIGTFGNALSSEVAGASAVYISSFRMMAFGFQIFMFLALSMVISWQVTLISIGAGGIVAILLSRFIGLARRSGLLRKTALDQLSRRIVDALQGMKPLKAMALEGHLVPLLESDTADLNRATRMGVTAKESLAALQEPLIVLFLSAGLFVAITFFTIPLEPLLVMALLFYRAASRFGDLQRAYQATRGQQAFWEAINGKINDALRAEEPSGSKEPRRFSREIEFQNVTFGYPERPVLDNLSLIVPARQITTVYGPSGSGKTTIVDLLIGLYRPSQGSIVVDGEPLDDLDLNAWRKQIGYLPQDVFLFHDTVLRNVTMGDSRYTDEDARQALETAEAFDHVSNLKDGMETLVGERGSKFSGGQRQRIALARALIRKPSLLILDEPTTALDPKTEEEICATLVSLSRTTTILAISHQPALAEIAQNVLMLEARNQEPSPAASMAT
jgi:ATP-binding cassette, subfamily C, bacterial